MESCFNFFENAMKCPTSSWKKKKNLQCSVAHAEENNKSITTELFEYLQLCILCSLSIYPAGSRASGRKGHLSSLFACDVYADPPPARI